MAISGYILKNKEKYSIEKIKNDVKSAAAKLKLHISEEPAHLDADNEFSYIQFGIYDDIAFNLSSEDLGNYDVEQGESFSLYIYPINERYESDKAFDWIKEGEKLHKVLHIEDIEGKEEIIFKFIHAYLKLNDKDYFWSDNDWAYTLGDLEKISRLPFDENWCYKNPN